MKVLAHDIPSDVSGIENCCFFVHGSADSKDEDRLYLFPSIDGRLPPNELCVKFCNNPTDSKEDRNLFCIREEHVCTCFRGLPDEIQNQLLATYSLHPQKWPLPFTKPATRVIPLKIADTAKYIVLQVRRTKYREKAIKALKANDVAQLFEFLKEVRLSELELEKDTLKNLAFRIAQTLALMQAKEFYTKASLAEAFSSLAPFLKREEGDLKRLDEQLAELVNTIGKFVRISKKANLQLFQLKEDLPKEDFELFRSTYEAFWNQSNGGVIVDLALSGARTFFYGLERDAKQREKISSGNVIYLVPDKKAAKGLLAVSELGFDDRHSVKAKALLKKSKYNWQALQLSRHFVILAMVEEKRLELLAMRNQFSLQLVDQETLSQFAKKSSIPLHKL